VRADKERSDLSAGVALTIVLVTHAAPSYISVIENVIMPLATV
jgi:hypothetical protein